MKHPPARSWNSQWFVPTGEQQQVLQSSAPALIISALAGTGLPELRALLASIVLERVAGGEPSGEDAPSDDPAP